MPDPTRESVSASQAAALFNQSPYFSRWMLHHHFRDGLSLDAPADDRMDFGKLLQDPILKMTAAAYRLEIVPNATDDYIRRGRLGATVDGRMLKPDVGNGIVEVKNIDWLRWRQTWTETAAAPHVEIQLQAQMYADDAEWGIIAALVGGNEMKFYERERNAELCDRLVEESAHFFEAVGTGLAPDPLASPIELPMLAQLYPATDPAERIEDLEDEDLAITLRQLGWAQDQKRFAEKLEGQMKAKLLARAGSAASVYAKGARCWITKSAIAEAHIVRAAHTRTLIKVERDAPEMGGIVIDGERYIGA